MRLPYQVLSANLSPENDAIVKRIEARRGARGLSVLDLALLHAPKIADGWNIFFGAVRDQNSLPDAVREIGICRTGLINEAWFEWNAHAPILLSSPGFTQEKLEVVKQRHPTHQGPLNDQEWVALRYADAMTRDVTVSQSLFDELKAVGFGEREIVELTVTIASYNMVSRFLVALDIGEANSRVPPGLEDRSSAT